MLENADRPLRPMVELSPEACAEVRRALAVAAATFRKWGIALPQGTWIQDAAEWLDHVVAENSLGNTQEELERTTAAVALAVDMYHISTTLGAESNRQV